LLVKDDYASICYEKALTVESGIKTILIINQ
jgi:hypothetical protein